MGASLEDVPDWVPLFPDANETSGTFQATSPEGTTGVVAQVTDEEIGEVLYWFKEWFEEEGFESGGETLTTTPEGSFGGVTGESADTGRTISVAVIETEEGTQITINYNQKT